MAKLAVKGVNRQSAVLPFAEVPISPQSKERAPCVFARSAQEFHNALGKRQNALAIVNMWLLNVKGPKNKNK